MDIKQHLKDRNLDMSLYSAVWLNERECIATFGLWNLSGSLVGFQQYRPLATKERNKNPRKMRYFTIIGKVGKIAKLGAFGVDLLNPKQRIIYITEGIFDAAPFHIRGVNAIATLANNPKHLAEWLRSLGYHLIAVCDGDDAGMKLANVADVAIFLPKDCDAGDMDDKWFDWVLGV